MTQAKPLALLSLALALAGCANDTYSPKRGDRGLPLRVDTPCRKRGCDNDKLFFNPATPEPSVNSIHRGW